LRNNVVDPGKKRFFTCYTYLAKYLKKSCFSWRSPFLKTRNFTLKNVFGNGLSHEKPPYKSKKKLFGSDKIRVRIYPKNESSFYL
jgi:hypothetical protein